MKTPQIYLKLLQKLAAHKLIRIDVLAQLAKTRIFWIWTFQAAAGCWTCTVHWAAECIRWSIVACKKIAVPFTIGKVRYCTANFSDSFLHHEGEVQRWPARKLLQSDLFQSNGSVLFRFFTHHVDISWCDIFKLSEPNCHCSVDESLNRKRSRCGCCG